MKKLLSAILAITMCMALIPAAAVAADTEAADGVISYKITSEAVKNDDVFAETHNITTNDTGDKLIFGTTEKDPTTFNVIANLQGTRASFDSSIANAETAFVTYRELDYNMYVSVNATTNIATYTPVRAVRNSITSGLEKENDATKVYKMPSTLDLSKTAPYELMGRNYNDNNHGLNAAGVFETFKLFTKNATTGAVTNNMEATQIVRRPGYIVRIKVEEPGTYKVKAYNNFTVGSKEGVDYSYIREIGSTELYNVNIASECDVYVVPVPANGLEFDYSTYGRPNYVYVGGKSANDWRDKAEKLSGTYSSYPGTVKLFEDNIEFEEGEYLVSFEVNKETVDSVNYSDTCFYSNNYLQNFLLSGIDLIPVSEEELAMKEAIAEEVTEAGLSENSYVNIITASVDSADDAFEETTTKIEATRGENVTVNAATVEGYDFLYWRSGLGANAKVITNNPECTVKAVPGTWLTAVYKKADSEKVSVLFYNANGDIIENKLVDKDTEITFPENPTAPAGCGSFSGWAFNTKNNIVASANATGSSMVFVAQFKDSSEKDITVTVPDGATGGGNYAYGDEITVKAAETSESGIFAYWKKGDEVVSFDASYTFNAWEACELTAVYLAEVPTLSPLRKIILKDGIAEFIGLDAAAEKGVIFKDDAETEVTLGNATHKIAMTTDGNHLAFNNDLEGSGKTNYIGYAILENGNVIYDK